MDDDAQVAKVVSQVLHRAGAEVVVTGSVDGAYEVMQAAAPFDLAVVDVGLPDGTGFSVVKLLRASHRPCGAVVMTGLLDATVVARCLEHGAVELLAKPCGTGEMVASAELALDHTRRWRRWLDEVGAGDAEYFTTQRKDSDRILVSLSERGQLTQREREALALLLGGAQNIEIAERLGISSNTVKYHVRNLLRKLGFDSRTDLFRALARNRGE